MLLKSEFVEPSPGSRGVIVLVVGKEIYLKEFRYVSDDSNEFFQTVLDSAMILLQAIVSPPAAKLLI